MLKISSKSFPKNNVQIFRLASNYKALKFTTFIKLTKLIKFTEFTKFTKISNKCLEIFYRKSMWLSIDVLTALVIYSIERFPDDQTKSSFLGDAFALSFCFNFSHSVQVNKVNCFLHIIYRWCRCWWCWWLWMLGRSTTSTTWYNSEWITWISQMNYIKWITSN